MTFQKLLIRKLNEDETYFSHRFSNLVKVHLTIVRIESLCKWWDIFLGLLLLSRAMWNYDIERYSQWCMCVFRIALCRLGATFVGH